MAINVKSPSSYFFTEQSFSQASNGKAFGPVATSTNEFQITTTFAGALNAYAVTDGILLIGLQKLETGQPHKINILLKPTKGIGLGIKIKYFVFRGINADDFFTDLSGTALMKPESTLSFIRKAWDAYEEFNQTTADFMVSKVGLIDASAGLTKELIKKYFTTENYNLLKVKEGTSLGKFVDGAGGFEIVLDEGDYSQEQSDTGLEFNESFATAKECVLKADGNNPDLEIFGGNISGSDSKIFKENIYKFLDPAAFYGSHVTDNTNNTANKGIISIGSTSYSSMSDIYTFIIKKFKNKYNTYFYVKGNSNRNLNFYNVNSNTLKINGTVQDLSTADWPIIILSPSYCTIEFTNLQLNDSLYSSTFLIATSALSVPSKAYLFSKVSGIYTCNLPFVNDSGNKVFSSFTYLSFNNSTTNKLDYLFGPVNLNSIFEREDFTNTQVSAINHLRSILIREANDIGCYNTKIILEGYIADSDPATIPTDPLILAQTLRTYILLEKESTKQETDVKKINLTAGYYNSMKNSEDYCNRIFGGGEIWKGTLKDGTAVIWSLLYKKDYSAEEMPIYQLGISQLDFKTLTENVDSNATNLLFNFENETVDTSASFLKYDLKIQFDKIDGTRAKTTSSITVYTIDGYFFFTQDYSKNFKYYKEFAETTVEFRPHQDWDGEFGMDWYRKGQYTWADTTGNKIYDTGFAGNVGTLPNQTDGNSYNPLSSFLADNNMLAKLKNNEYNLNRTNWSLADNETECFTSWLSLDKGKTAKLNLRIRVKKAASKLSIRYPNKYFKINNTNGYTDPSDINFSFFDFPATVKRITAKARFFDLDINCIEEFGSTQVLEVRADEKLAGMLKVLTNNNKPVQNILFVPVKIEMPDTIERGFTPGVGESPVTSNYISNHKNWLVQLLLQSQIKANIEMYNDTNIPLVGDDYKQLNLISDINFKDEFAPDNGNPANNKGMFTKKDVAGTLVTYSLRAFYEPSQTNRLDLKQYLINHLPAKYTDAKYKSYLIVFFINIDGYNMINDTTSKSQLNGYSSGKWTNLLVFKLAVDNNETVSHEVYHSLGIPHTFDKTGENSLYVYKGKQTDNLLDYSHHNPPSKNRRSLFHWQWLIARKNVKK